MGKAMGYFLGFFVGGIIITLAINLLFFNRHKATDEEIAAFMANSEVLPDEIKKEYHYYKYNPDNVGYHLGPNLKTFKQYYSRSGGGSSPYYIFIYYSPRYKRHIGLLPAGEGTGVTDGVYHMDYLLYVNKAQWQDPSYGTLQKPVPVLWFTGVQKSLRKDNNDFNEAYKKENYYDNIFFYLSYIIDKEDFKKLFPKD